MALFPPWSNSLVSAALVLFLCGAIGGLVALWLYVRSPYNTHEGEQVVQPVRFDHRHHVGDDGIDCRYCHATVERAPYAGVPAVAVCMGCHNQIWSDSSDLASVRNAYFADTPLVWQRVTSLPDYVYFDHSIHIARGVGCVTCHGRVDLMANVSKAHPLTMQWCLDCHRDPAPELRPADRVTDLAWRPEDPRKTGEAIIASQRIAPPTNCSACHR